MCVMRELYFKRVLSINMPDVRMEPGALQAGLSTVSALTFSPRNGPGLEHQANVGCPTGPISLIPNPMKQDMTIFTICFCTLQAPELDSAVA